MQAKSLTENEFMNLCGDWMGTGIATRSWNIFGKYGLSLQHIRCTITLKQFGGVVIGGTPKKYGVKKVFSCFVCFLCFTGSPAIGARFCGV